MPENFKVIKSDPIYKNYGYIFVIFFICTSSIVFYYFTNAENIADYDSYLGLIDKIYYFYDTSELYFEPASTFLLYISRIITSETVQAVTLARYFTTFVLILAIYVLGKYKNVSTTALVFVVAIFGPLLAFVTIRATPAYMLIAVAALDANSGRRRAIIWAFLAFQFHVSAILAVPAIAFSLIQNRTNVLAFIERSLNGVVAFLAIIGLVIVFLGQSFSALLLQSVGQIGFLAKYITYVAVLDQTNTTISSNESYSQIYHQIYTIIASILFVFILYSKDVKLVRSRSFIIISYAIFLFLQFSPVTAFRYSLFWIIPALLLMPWNLYLKQPLLRASAILFCLAAFAYQLSGIVE